MTEKTGIEAQFRAWVNERDLDAKAEREGMARIVKPVGRHGAAPQLQSFEGRLLVGPPDLPKGHQVYVTRRGKLAYYRSDNRGGGWLDAYESREALSAALGPNGRDIAETIYEAVSAEVEELDW
jgi:hypothetical protein